MGIPETDGPKGQPRVLSGVRFQSRALKNDFAWCNRSNTVQQDGQQNKVGVFGTAARAQLRRGFGARVRKPLFSNLFPASPRGQNKFAVDETKVRTDVFEFNPIFLQIVAVGDKFRLFRAVNEGNRRFEPRWVERVWGRGWLLARRSRTPS